jgi:hypothetical protein
LVSEPGKHITKLGNEFLTILVKTRRGLLDLLCGYTMDTSSRDITTFLDEFKNQLIESINKVFEKYNYDKDKECEVECTHEKDIHVDKEKSI